MPLKRHFSGGVLFLGSISIIFSFGFNNGPVFTVVEIRFLMIEYEINAICFTLPFSSL